MGKADDKEKQKEERDCQKMDKGKKNWNKIGGLGPENKRNGMIIQE